MSCSMMTEANTCISRVIKEACLRDLHADSFTPSAHHLAAVASNSLGFVSLSSAMALRGSRIRAQLPPQGSTFSTTSLLGWCRLWHGEATRYARRYSSTAAGSSSPHLSRAPAASPSQAQLSWAAACTARRPEWTQLG